MQHSKYPFILLALLGCSSNAEPTAAEQQDLNREPLHRHMHKVLGLDGGTTTTTTNDSGTTSTQDAGSQQQQQQQDSGTQQQQQDSGTQQQQQQQQDSGTQQQQNNFIPAGWLYTSGNHVYVSNGTSGSVWVGRGVNVDDTYLCGYNGSQWMTNSETVLTSMMSNVVTNWKPSFVRMSLSLYSYPQTPASWIGTSAYKTSMTNVIESMTKAGVYVMVTLRSDSTMQEGAGEPTGLQTASTDPTYVALVDTFANDSHVMFGLSNEPGGNAFSNAQIRSAMDHATSVIRAEEDKLGVPHHVVSVQGNGWTSDISFYSSSPLSQDNVVYEVHGYPPPASSYTYSNIAVVIGEYGTLSNAPAFFADLESKQIPSLAWDFEPYSDCAPDLVSVNLNPTSTVDTSWGSTVQAYLLAH